MDRFVRIISVRAATDETTYVATVVLADAKDVETVVDYVSRESDPYGLAPQVRAAILQWIADGKPVDPYVPEPEPVPQVISRRQFYQGLAVAEFISKQEALDAIRMVSLPAPIQLMIDNMEDEDAAFEASSLLYGAGEFYRDHSFVMVFAITQGMTEEDVDNFWRLCSLL